MPEGDDIDKHEHEPEIYAERYPTAVRIKPKYFGQNKLNERHHAHCSSI